MATSINLSDITSNVATDSDYNVTGDGYFDDIMETMTAHLQAQYDAGRITGDSYARVYMNLAQSAMGQAIQFALTKRSAELRADGLEQDVLKKTEDYQVLTGTYDAGGANETTVRQAKIDTIVAQRDKAIAEASYIDEQETQLIASVGYNNKLKVMDSLADTYGTFGAGGLTLSSDMWSTYFGIANDVAGATVPTSTTVTKVT